MTDTSSTSPPREESETQPVSHRVWSVGYEKYKLVTDFAEELARHGIRRLIDVRELPISRRKGYAKTALAEALAKVGIEYVHRKDLGNPKPIRDIYKSGNVQVGRDLYRAHLDNVAPDAVKSLHVQLLEKPTALMCVESDQDTCHRNEILQVLLNINSELVVSHITR